MVWIGTEGTRKWVVYADDPPQDPDVTAGVSQRNVVLTANSYGECHDWIGRQAKPDQFSVGMETT